MLSAYRRNSTFRSASCFFRRAYASGAKVSSSASIFSGAVRLTAARAGKSMSSSRTLEEAR